MDPAQDGTNWYAAFGNDPVNYADPSGLTPAFHPLKGFGKGAPGLSPAHRALIASQPLAPPPGSGQYFGGLDINLGVSSAHGTPNLGERPCICGYAADEHLGREKQRGQEQQRGQIVLTPFSTPCLHCPAGFNRAMVHHATRRTTILIREVRMLRVLAIACPLWAAGALLVPRCGVESAIAQTVVATSTTDLPTAEEVLSVIRANQARLNPLHFQCRFIEERTEAYAESKRLQAMGLEKLLESIERGEGVAELEAQAPGISSEAYRQELRDQVETSQELAQPVCFEHHFEFFIDGDNYQVRSPLNSRDVSQKFPAGPLTADALTSEFARIRIYSRSTSQSPPGQIWQGQSNADAAIYATTTSKHFGDSHSTNVPPLTRALRASSHDIHPIDMFLAAPPDRYRVVGQETKEGRLLTIVDVLVPTEQVGSTTGADGKQEQFKIAYEMRAWLDLERGGVPALLKMWYGSEKSELDERLRALPWRVITTAEVKELESGAFYPTRTVEEEFNTDPKTPSPSDAEWAEVRAGKRASPPQVVFQRRTWECSAIDTNPFGGEQFFVLTFPAGAAHFDLDAGKVVGALETTPPIPLGEPAPPLDVARWVDGQQRSLEDFRGKVVVLHFWSFSCSGCLRGIPALNAVQQKFQDHPVVFISVHQACHDADSVVNRIDSLAKETHWGYLAAIDAGTMAQNSATFYAYGCAGQPTEVILGRDGRVAWHSGIPPAGMESFYGKSCDEITADDEAVINRYMQAEFEAAGETWPMAEGLPEEEQLAVSNRMLAFQIGRHIEAALASASAK